jgi:hypothetical protein
MSAVFHSGATGTCTIGSGATEVPLIHWSVRPTAQMAEFRNSKSGGYVLREAGFKDAMVEFEIDFDFGASPFGAPLSIGVGAILTSVKLYLNGGTGGTEYWSFPSLIISATPQRLAVEGRITTRVQCVANGSFSYPV